jgi:hypothetical protein
MAKKKNNTNLIILGAAFAALMLLLLITSGGDESQGLGKDGGPLFSGIEVMDLNAVLLDYDWEIEFMGRVDNIGLQREEDAWYITEPRRYKTDPAKAAEFLEKVLSLQSSRRLEPDASELAKYGLDTPRLIVNVSTEEQTLRLLVGNDFVTSVDEERIAIAYVMFEGDSYVYIVDARTIDELNETPDNLRFRNVFQFDRGDLVEVSFDYKGRTLEFSREDGNWFIEGASGRRPIRNERMTAFLADFYNISVDGFILDEGLAWDYDIDPGKRDYLRVLCSKRGEMMLSFGREINERVVCMVEGDPAIYEVDKFKYERLNQEEAYFLGEEDAPVLEVEE